MNTCTNSKKHYTSSFNTNLKLLFRVEEYMRQLPMRKVPRMGSEGERYRHGTTEYFKQGKMRKIYVKRYCPSGIHLDKTQNPSIGLL